jgi:hypothetical protein
VHVDTHVSTCTRCQAMLATFVRAAPASVEPATVAPIAAWFWHRWQVRWLVPVAAAATAVAVWVSQADRAQAPVPSDVLARLEPPAPLEPPTRTVELRAPSNAVPARSRDLTDQRAGASAAGPRPRTTARVDDSALQRTALAKTGVGSPVSERIASEQAVLERAASGAADAVALAPGEAARLREADRELAEQPAAAPPAPSALAPVQARRVAAAQAPLEIQSVSHAARWRIRDGRQVDYATAAGAVWTPASLPQADGLIAGDGPSASVCWIVGRAGLVLRTTDALRFVRIPFPETVDLISVRGIDARTATVTSQGGASFRTDDGGATWVRFTR